MGEFGADVKEDVDENDIVEEGGASPPAVEADGLGMKGEFLYVGVPGLCIPGTTPGVLGREVCFMADRRGGMGM